MKGETPIKEGTDGDTLYYCLDGTLEAIKDGASVLHPGTEVVFI